MDLHSGYPYWLVKNGLPAEYPKLNYNLTGADVVIIGSGISGALMAHQLCSAGFNCIMVDKRLPAAGSTWASTAHVNYEPDMPLHRLIKQYGEAPAVTIYQSAFDGVKTIYNILKDTGIDAAQQEKSAMYLASNNKGAKEIEREFTIRTKHGFNVVVLDNARLQADYNIDRPNALYHADAMQLDPYKATIGLIQYHIERNRLKLFTRTEVGVLDATPAGVTLTTTDGYRIEAKTVVCCAGYEAGGFLPTQPQNLVSTYALITPPVNEAVLWKKQCLVWETARPYLYLRTTADNRIIIGGQDIPFKNATLRDALLPKKTDKLIEQANQLFPYIPLQPEFSWCGTFGETKDSLPYIGQYPGIPNVYFSLGYGGNGTVFSQIGAEIVTNLLQGKNDERAKLFGFER